MHVSSSSPALPSLAETAATNVSRFMSSIGPASSVPRDMNNQPAASTTTNYTRRLDDLNNANRFPRVHNSFTRLWLDQQNRLEMERRRMRAHQATNLHSSSTPNLAQHQPSSTSASPAIQTSVSISTGANQTNLAHIATNTNVNEFGIQHISIPGMQISIGSVPTNTNLNTNNSNIHQHGSQIASVNVNLSNNPQSISFLSNGSNGQNIITFPNGNMMSSPHSNGLMSHMESVPSLSSISALAGALHIHAYQPTTNNAQPRQATSAPPPPPPPSVRLHRSHGPMNSNQNPYVFNYNPNSQNGQSVHSRQQSHPYSSLNQQVNNTYHHSHQHAHNPHLHHPNHHHIHLNRREDFSQTTPFMSSSSTLLPQAYMDVSNIFSLTRENMIAHMNPRVRIPRILLDRSIEVLK